MSALAGKTVLVTRPQAQAQGFVRELESLGAIVYAMPVIEIQPPESYDRLDRALSNLESYDWVVLTSVNGVRAVVDRMNALDISLELLKQRKLAAIGPATAGELAASVRAPDLVPKEFVSEAIAEALDKLGVQAPAKFLLARADIARRDLADLLLARGMEVDEVAAYRIVKGAGATDLPAKAPDLITLTSSSAARGTLEMLRAASHEDWMSESKLVCIGPVTSATVREMGFEVAAEAAEYTVPGLLSALQKVVQNEVHAHA